MQTRRLGSSDLDVTRLGFGAWAIGGAGWEYAWGPQDDDESVGAIHRALELGVNWIDTAAVYGRGHSEEIVARALGEWRGARPLVFTKCGLVWDDAGRVTECIAGDSIRRECEASLRRLRTDAIDLYQIHWPTDDIGQIDDAWSTMAALRQEGKVRWIGVSNFDVAWLRAAQAIARVTSLQPPYSLVHPEAERELLPFCRAQGIGVIVYSPMASGLLSGAMTRERAATLPTDDWRRRSPDFQEPALSRHLALVERLRTVGRRHGCTPGQVAIAWTLRNPAVTGAIVGARSAAQVDGVFGGGAPALTDDDVVELRRG